MIPVAPDGDWLQWWTERAWEFAFDPHTLERARNRGIPLRVDAAEFSSLRPTVSIVPSLPHGYIAVARGSHAPRWAAGWSDGTYGVFWSAGAMKKCKLTRGGWLSIVVHEVAHHLAPPIREPGRKRNVHGSHFRTAHTLIATRLAGVSFEELDTSFPPAPGRRVTYRSVDYRIGLMFDTLRMG